jgi:hypothetical protein
MLSLIIWLTGILLEALSLFRSFHNAAFTKYPFFFAYIASSLAGNVLLLYVRYKLAPESYPEWYGSVQFVTLILGYGIILEILKHVLSPYPGAEKFARMVGIGVFVGIFCFAVAYPFILGEWSQAGTDVELERDLRTVQAIFLFGLLGVISYYRIAIGKNMKGMILAYGLYIATSLGGLAVRSYAPSFDAAWNIIQPFSYLVSLSIWLSALWSYQPNPVPALAIRLETDYEDLVSRTQTMMGAVRSHFAKAARP